MAVVLAYCTCAIVWGTTWFAIRVCIGPNGYEATSSAAVRFSIAAAVLWGVLLLRRNGRSFRSARQRWWFALAGVLNGSGYALVYVGEKSVSGAFAAVLFGTMPIITGFWAIVTKTERVTKGDAFGAAASLLGVAIIFSDRLAVSLEQAHGIILLFVAVLLSSMYSIILKREGGEVSVLRSTAFFLAVTAATLWLIALASGQVELPWPPPLAPSIAILYLALFGSILTFGSYLFLLQRVSLMVTTTLVFLYPVVALFVDAIWEPNAQLTPNTYLGAFVTLGGVVLSVLWQHRRGSS